MAKRSPSVLVTEPVRCLTASVCANDDRPLLWACGLISKAI